MTPTPTLIRSVTTQASPTRVKLRKRAMRRANVTYGQLAAAAHVSYSMVFKWANGTRTSRPIETAWLKLTGTEAPQ